MTRHVREADLEIYFSGLVRRSGGLAYKIAPTAKGIPDRFVIWPGGLLELVELKTETGRLSPAQRLWHAHAAECGVEVTVLYGADQIKTYVESHRSRSESLRGSTRTPTTPSRYKAFRIDDTPSVPNPSKM